jgi:hypothetical protein
LLADTHEERKEAEQCKKEQMKDKVREQSRLHQQAFHSCQAEKKRVEGVVKPVKMMKLDNDIGDMSAVSDIADISRVKPGQCWRKNQNGKQNGVIRGWAQRTNWCHPFLHSIIHLAALKKGFYLAQAIVDYLHETNPTLFKTLHKGTVQKWLAPDRKGWSEEHLRNVARCSALYGTGRVGVLAPYPEVVAEIERTLCGLQTAGVVVTQLISQSVILAIIFVHVPELLKTFQASEFYVRTFFESVIKWSVHAATQEAAHLPSDWMISCKKTLHQILNLMHLYDIPSDLLMNMDQTGIYVISRDEK